jgi:hypothetical protein
MAVEASHYAGHSGRLDRIDARLERIERRLRACRGMTMFFATKADLAGFARPAPAALEPFSARVYRGGNGKHENRLEWTCRTITNNTTNISRG